MQREQIVGAILSKLSQSQQALKSEWENPTGTKTRHLIIDNLLPPEIAEQAFNSFPRNGAGFFDRATFREKKSGTNNLNDFPALLGDITYALQDPRVVSMIADITGMKTIEPDPMLYAGGLTMMFKGDFLNPHLDNSHDSTRGKYRRLNLLYYLSPDWAQANGGNFELWDERRTTPKTLVSMRNRLVVMETHRYSWHSVSQVQVETPRCCISNYYFSVDSPDGEDYQHVTSFSGRPEERMKRVIGVLDNALRETASRILGRGRKSQLNDKEPTSPG